MFLLKIHLYSIFLANPFYVNFICRSFLIGWASTITVCDVRETPYHLTAPELPQKLVEIRHSFQLDSFFISGIAYIPSTAGQPSGVSSRNASTVIKPLVDSGIVPAIIPEPNPTTNINSWSELVVFCVCNIPNKDNEDEDSAAELEADDEKLVKLFFENFF